MPKRIEADDVARQLLETLGDRRRLVVAIAAPPGAGKSTLAAELRTAIDARHDGEIAVVVPMDGFHLDNAVLEARGLLSRKGAPETFDAAGFAALVARLRNEGEVVVPLFDRRRDLAVAGAGVVEPRHRIALVEGNYLLLDEAPWDRLAPLWDVTIWIEVPEDELERRLVRRWLDHGLDAEAARARALENDIPNARRVVANSRPGRLAVPGT